MSEKMTGKEIQSERERGETDTALEFRGATCICTRLPTENADSQDQNHLEKHLTKGRERRRREKGEKILQKGWKIKSTEVGMKQKEIKRT